MTCDLLKGNKSDGPYDLVLISTPSGGKALTKRGREGRREGEREREEGKEREREREGEGRSEEE